LHARLGWLGLIAGLLALAAAYAVAAIRPEASAIEWLTIVGISTSQAGMLAIGAARSGRLSQAATLATFTVLLVPLLGFGAVLLLSPETVAGPYWLGLPRRAAIVLLGVGVLPMLVLPFAYAHAHRPDTLAPEQLAQLRRRAAELRGEAPTR